MTIDEFDDLKTIETAKVEALGKIVAILVDLEDIDEDAVAWVLEKINE